MTALLFQLLKHGWQPLRELWREGGVDEILFEQRNKSYGAYQLRRNEGWYLLTALSIVLGGMLSLGWASTLRENEEIVPKFVGLYGCHLSLPLPPPLEEIEVRWLVFPRIPEPQVVSMHDFMPEFDTRADLGDSLKSLEPKIPTEWLIPEITEEEELIFEASNEMPKHNEFIFCDQEPKVLNMKEAIEKHPLPHILQSSCIEGYVIFRVLVSAEGMYLDHKVITSVHPILTTYFSKVMPDLRFEPADCEGENIAFWVNIPMNYKILK